MTKQPNKVNKASGKVALFTAYCGVLAETVSYFAALPQMGKTLSSDELGRRQDQLMQHWSDLKDLEPIWDGWTARKKRQPKPEKVVTRYHFPDLQDHREVTESPQVQRLSDPQIETLLDLPVILAERIIYGTASQIRQRVPAPIKSRAKKAVKKVGDFFTPDWELPGPDYYVYNHDS